MSLLRRMKAWYQGAPIVVDMPSRKLGSAVFIGTPFLAGTRYHWSAKIARATVSFYLQHWQWLWGLIAATVTSVVVAWLFS